MSNIIFHIDVNNAFLSWSAVDMLKKGYPVDLRNVASAVAGDPTLRHGVILAKSTIAKKMGVKTGESIAEAKKKCKNLQLTPPNHELYNSESNKLKKLLEKYSDKIEQFSIDEFFIEYIPALGPYMTVAQNIQDEITNTLGITVNIGISTNKLLAKMASDFEKPNKIHTLFPNEIESKMWPLPVGELIFCGNSAQKKLNLIGIKTIGDLAKSSKDTIYRLLKNPGLQLHEYANGIDNSKINYIPSTPKSISQSTTLSCDLTSITQIEKVILTLCNMTSSKLRAQNLSTKTISICLRTNTFKDYSTSKTLCFATDTTNEIYKVCKELLSNVYSNEKIRLVGVSLSNLESSSSLQLSFLDKPNEKYSKIDKIMDEICNKYPCNKQILTRASLINNNNNNININVKEKITTDNL